MITVDELQRKYPNPRAAAEAPRYPDDYCVGGTLWAEIWQRGLDERYSNYFPTFGKLASLMQDNNPRLGQDAANEMSQNIIRLNDARQFEDAWAWLRKGLEG